MNKATTSRFNTQRKNDRDTRPPENQRQQPADSSENRTNAKTESRSTVNRNTRPKNVQETQQTINRGTHPVIKKDNRPNESKETRQKDDRDKRRIGNRDTQPPEHKDTRHRANMDVRVTAKREQQPVDNSPTADTYNDYNKFARQTANREVRPPDKRETRPIENRDTRPKDNRNTRPAANREAYPKDNSPRASRYDKSTANRDVRPKANKEKQPVSDNQTANRYAKPTVNRDARPTNNRGTQLTANNPTSDRYNRQANQKDVRQTAKRNIPPVDNIETRPKDNKSARPVAKRETQPEDNSPRANRYARPTANRDIRQTDERDIHNATNRDPRANDNKGTRSFPNKETQSADNTSPKANRYARPTANRDIRQADKRDIHHEDNRDPRTNDNKGTRSVANREPQPADNSPRANLYARPAANRDTQQLDNKDTRPKGNRSIRPVANIETKPTDNSPRVSRYARQTANRDVRPVANREIQPTTEHPTGNKYAKQTAGRYIRIPDKGEPVDSRGPRTKANRSMLTETNRESQPADNSPRASRYARQTANRDARPMANKELQPTAENATANSYSRQTSTRDVQPADNSPRANGYPRPTANRDTQPTASREIQSTAVNSTESRPKNNRKTGPLANRETQPVDISPRANRNAGSTNNRDTRSTASKATHSTPNNPTAKQAVTTRETRATDKREMRHGYNRETQTKDNRNTRALTNRETQSTDNSPRANRYARPTANRDTGTVAIKEPRPTDKRKLPPMSDGATQPIGYRETRHAANRESRSTANKEIPRQTANRETRPTDNRKLSPIPGRAAQSTDYRQSGPAANRDTRADANRDIRLAANRDTRPTDYRENRQTADKRAAQPKDNNDIRPIGNRRLRPDGDTQPAVNNQAAGRSARPPAIRETPATEKTRLSDTRGRAMANRESKQTADNPAANRFAKPEREPRPLAYRESRPPANRETKHGTNKETRNVAQRETRTDTNKETHQVAHRETRTKPNKETYPVANRETRSEAIREHRQAATNRVRDTRSPKENQESRHTGQQPIRHTLDRKSRPTDNRESRPTANVERRPLANRDSQATSDKDPKATSNRDNPSTKNMERIPPGKKEKGSMADGGKQPTATKEARAGDVSAMGGGASKKKANNTHQSPAQRDNQPRDTNHSSSTPASNPTPTSDTPHKSQPTKKPVEQDSRDMYKSFKSDNAQPNTSKPSGTQTQNTGQRTSNTKQIAAPSTKATGKVMPWREALDKVSSLELWDGKAREERGNWADYLTRADALVRKPRKTIPQDVVRAILEGDMSSVDLSTVPNAQPKVAVFVSSTFTDTKAERNQLMKDVYPYLRSVCRRLGVDFGTVDMRWGVTEEATNDHSTTDMCVKEIHRCMKDSAGPAFLCLLGYKYGYRPLPAKIVHTECMKDSAGPAFLCLLGHKYGYRPLPAKIVHTECMKDSAGPAFLCLLGHKYGYRPLPAKIVHTEYEPMLAHLRNSGKDVTLITSFYQKDENAVPTEYVLIPKTDEHKTWWDDVEKIQEGFREASVACFGESDKRCDKYHISVTETEIHNGVFNNPNAAYQSIFVRRDLKDYASELHKDRKIVDMKGKEIDEYARGKLAELKETKVPQIATKSPMFDVEYENASEADIANYIRSVCDEVCTSLVETILESYEKRLHVKEDPEFLEAVQHRDHALEKASLFIGRQREIGLIKKYLGSDSRHPLVIHGPSGCGKTALMAVATKTIKASKSNGVVVLRFLGTTGLSGSARNAMISVCTQLSRVYGKDVTKIPASYKELIKYFRECMGFATAAKPLFLVLDSLDQLSTEDFGQNLKWLSLAEELPENVKLIVSSLPTKCLDILKAYVPVDNLVEVQLLQANEGPEIIKKMLQLQNRKVTGQQDKIITDAFKKCPLPLFLRLSVDIALRWHSYDDVTSGDIADDMPGLITMLFDRLESRYGEMFVHHALSYITASKHGLSLAELEDVLSCDDQVLDSVFKWWVPPVRRIPPLLWARVRNELGIYLAERGTNGVSAYGWYHRQFWETAEKRYLENTFGDETGPFRQKAHAAIADYFEGKWEHGKPHVGKKDGVEKVEDRKLPNQPIILSGDRKSGRQLNRRKLAELPYHLIQLRNWERFQTLAIDLIYVEAQFETGNGFNCLSELIEATKLSGADVIKQMTRFVGADLAFLIRESTGVYQMALQQTKRSMVRKLLERIKEHDFPVPLMTNMHEQDFNDPCEMTLTGHTETVRTCDYSPKGDLLLSSADDSTMRIWDATTGAEVVCVTSLPEPVWPGKHETNQLMLHPVNPCCFSRDGQTIGSGTEQGQVYIWDQSGGQIASAETDHPAVTFVKFSPDNKVFATAFKDGAVMFWDAKDLGRLGNVQTGKETTCLDYSPDGGTVAVMTLAEKKFFENANGRQTDGHTDAEVTHVPKKGGRKKIAIANPELYPAMALVDTNSYSIKAMNRAACYQNLCCVYHPEGKQIMSGGDDSKVSIWDAQSGSFQTSLQRHRAWIWSIKFTKDGNHMFTCSSDRSMKVWQRQGGGDWEVTATVGGHSHRVSMVSIEAITESKLVTSSLDRSLKVWDTKALIQGDIPPAGQGHFTSCLTSLDGRYLATSQGWHHMCNVVDLTAGGNLLGSTQNHKGFVRHAQFTYDGSRLFVLDHGHSGGYERGSEQYAKIKVTNIPGMTSDCGGLAVDSPVSFCLTNKHVIVGTANKTLHMFDITSYEQLNQWESGLEGFVGWVAASRSTNRLVACHDTTCQIWDASPSHSTHIKDLTEHDSTITEAQFSPDGRMLIVGTNSGWLYAYDTSRDDTPLLTIKKQHATYIYNIVFSGDGNLMVSSAGLSMRVWNVGESIELRCTYYAPVNRADFINNNSVVVGEATGRQVVLSF